MTSAKKNNLVARALAFVMFSMISALAGVAQKRCDVILVMSPPLTLGLAGWLAVLRHRAPLVLNIQDIHPEAAVATGSISNPKIISMLESLEFFSYKKADAITALSDDLRLNIANRIEHPDKVRVIPNFVDTDRIYPDSKFNNYRIALGLTDEVVVMYAGNLGYSQPIEIVIDAARRLQHRQEIVFVINGEGSRRVELEAKAAGIENMRFVDFASYEDLNEVLAAADIHLILLKPGLGTASVPSKLYSILAAGRPVLASVDTGTEIDLVVSRTGAGRSVSSNDNGLFAETLIALVDDPVGRDAAGKAGRKFAEEWLSADSVAQSYDELFEELLFGVVNTKKNFRRKL
jgi:colanic acid biosynthesis glycosyl transferase WcaI